MRFLVDAQLPPALAQWLKERGHDATAARDKNNLAGLLTRTSAHGSRLRPSIPRD